MKVRIKKLNPEAVIPVKAHPSDAGFDLTAISMEPEIERGIITYNTGLAIEIPEGYVGLIFPRSSVYKVDLNLSNCVGVIDSHYRGEIKAKFRMTALMQKIYKPGDRIMQMIIMPYPEIEFEEAEELTTTDRGEGGYGSTGK